MNKFSANWRIRGMKFYSLNKKSPAVSFKEATLRGQAPDKGLYFPEHIPEFDPSFFKDIENLSNEEIAFHVIHPYVSKDIPADELKRIVAETINFPIPLVQVNENISSLELFHGPTLAFKDVGARFMSRCLGYFFTENKKAPLLGRGVRGEVEKITVLVATSGDTGAAVANGFYNVAGVEVVILYPSGKVSSVQEKQLTTLGKNISALEVEGSFDDCQQMVKQAFADKELNKKIFLTSANSINIARWLPQQFYYFFAYKQWLNSPEFIPPLAGGDGGKNNPPVISVPCGNFGNICASLLAHISGLPVTHFIAACNANDVVPVYMQTENYQPKKAVTTLSNAMDVGNPSNFVRILELFDNNFLSLKEKLSSVSITDEETKTTIKAIKQSGNYLLDPHSAVGYLALERYLNEHPGQKGFFVETAHPVKFYDVVEPLINEKIPLPASVVEIIDRKKEAIKIGAEYGMLKEFLLK